MSFLRKMTGLAGALAFLVLAPTGVRAEVTNATPDFKEVYDLVRQHLAGQTAADLDRAAVQGFLTQLHSKVSLVEDASGTNGDANAPMLVKSATYDGPIGYLRVGRVDEGLAGNISSAVRELNQSNNLKGVVIDLRYAGGHDYAAATAVADLFVSKEVPLLDWGHGVVNSKAKPDAIILPIAVLVNHQTRGAAEALAAMLRESNRALVLGGMTAGEATIDQEFPLKSGQHLRIATATIKLGNGETLSANGVKPDIAVNVNTEDEKVFYADPFKEIVKPTALSPLGLSGTGTNGNASATNRSRPRTTEADLIRERKERPGVEVEGVVSAAREEETQRPVVRDPVLGRALDLIKGIAVLKPSRPS